MIELREWSAGIVFLAAIAGVYTLFWDGFDGVVLAATLVSFIAAYVIWPSKRKGQRQDGGRVVDMIEVLIEFPIELFVWIMRFLGRLAGGKGDGVDLDF
ncbi:hypothetical protein A3715_28390 [Oleiphilus sp. HI0009]|uniref:hypothetical protein n=1 Tax=unclassified Oleiphilus TaxID=2631174 RepID=UPI0007C3133D|nr:MULTISPECIES: hypothetical protein [unclassified Oleiphilus]KZX83777.1 hypothetical protein A3715_04755 [Oleiphilus sp. HI0009]KZX85338.1 hypothetical protein A3715_28390 [Oleiphilus sp. HI0009]KZY67945.1 hypothetical protein A3739_11495 [Oleiphilus sp. HI0067]KZY71698.1 hypothetical protein A3738_03285 [Oleiphilus sp. HI0066]